MGSMGERAGKLSRAVRLVVDGAVAEDAEYGGCAEDNAGVETVSEAETAE